MLTSNEVEKTLQAAGVHQKWTNAYRTADNEKFFDEAFNYIRTTLNPCDKALVLDVGCGVGAHSARLAKRGFSVLAVDFSEYILKEAELSLQSQGLLSRIKLQRENILALSFPDDTFDYIVCWGVLMHIPDIEKAIAELGRVLKRGGTIVISEANCRSIQSIILRRLKQIIGKEKASVKETAAGVEYWTVTPSGQLLTREANIGWLKESFKRRGFVVRQHVAGQFTELYNRMPSGILRNMMQNFNHAYFKYVKVPYFAFGNILIMQKV